MPRGFTLDFELTDEIRRKIIEAGQAQLGIATTAQSVGVKGMTFRNWLYYDCNMPSNICKTTCAQSDGHEAAKLYRQEFIESQKADMLDLSPAVRLNHSQYAKNIIESEGDAAEARANMGAEADARTRLDDELGKLTSALTALIDGGGGDD